MKNGLFINAAALRLAAALLLLCMGFALPADSTAFSDSSEAGRLILNADPGLSPDSVPKQITKDSGTVKKAAVKKGMEKSAFVPADSGRAPVPSIQKEAAADPSSLPLKSGPAPKPEKAVGKIPKNKTTPVEKKAEAPEADTSGRKLSINADSVAATDTSVPVPAAENKRISPESIPAAENKQAAAKPDTLKQEANKPKPAEVPETSAVSVSAPDTTAPVKALKESAKKGAPPQPAKTQLKDTEKELATAPASSAQEKKAGSKKTDISAAGIVKNVSEFEPAEKKPDKKEDPEPEEPVASREEQKPKSLIETFIPGTAVEKPAPVAQQPAAAAPAAPAENSDQPVRLFKASKIITTIILLIIGWFSLRYMAVLLNLLSERWPRYRLTIKGFIPIVRITGWTSLLTFIIVAVFRPPIESVIAFTASAGIAIGFASQDILKNIFGGIVILFDKPFKVGDKILIDGFYGEVVNIGLRTVRIVTADDSEIAIPNMEIVSKSVSNSNSGAPDCQVVAEFYFPSKLDVDAAHLLAVRCAYLSRYIYLNKPVAVVFENQMHGLKSMIKMRLKAYVFDHRFEPAFRSDLSKMVFREFRRAGLIEKD